MAKKIGIVAQDQPDNKFGVNKNYLQWIEQFGIPILILPTKAEDFKEIYKLDALVLPGGADVNPSRYRSISYYNQNPNIFLEYFDMNILPLLIGNIPIFGICRGLQTLNVHFGGTLQNLWFHPYSQFDEDEIHEILVKDRIAGDFKMKVNSFHHQAIKQMAGNFIKVAVSAGDKVIEAVADYDKNIFAVQWHPERLQDEFSAEIFNYILGKR